MADEARWQFFVDRGGTFTDCIARHPTSGALSVVKVPSSDDAPLIGMRRLLGLPEGAPIPPSEVRLGTTLGTNALLERRGARSVLLLTRGFGDLLELGDQTRPELFALEIRRPKPLPEQVLEVAARLDATGKILERPVVDQLRERLQELRRSGLTSAGVAILNDYRDGSLEKQLTALAREVGFEHVVGSCEVAPSIGYLARASTTAVDAYLTPLLQGYLSKLATALPGSRLLLMQSSGGLCEASRFRGTASVLSGPAGGAVALAAVARAAGAERAVGFDMGGTSTDVCRFDGALPRVFEAEVAGTRISAPMLAVHTVAAGGGSICRWDGQRLRVGPESVGAKPGPLCYGSAGAEDVALSDANLLLGRLIPDRFPLPLDAAKPLQKLTELGRALTQRGHAYSAHDVAEGFFRIATANMAQAIREVTVARGFDLREHALVVFGGAGGQHACALARELGVREILLHPLSGVLSALGIGMAELSFNGSRGGDGRLLDDAALSDCSTSFDELTQQGRDALLADGASPDSLVIEREVDLRYVGTETVLSLALAPAREVAAAFEAAFRKLFGHVHPNRAIELAGIRVSVRSLARTSPAMPSAIASRREPPPPARLGRLYLDGRWLEHVPVYLRESLELGTRLSGPAIVAEATGTIVLEPGFSLTAAADGLLRVEPEAATRSAAPRSAPVEPDPVLLEIYANRFMSIAEQMGRTLRLTAASVNIRERLDFSCAVFDAHGLLVANAPHIPVHLGAMSESVRAVVKAHPELSAGDIFVTNDPAAGGSHLPDITVVAPVHAPDGALSFFAAARGHHADIGGSTPGSMPAFSQTLAEEGVVLRAVRISSAGAFDRAKLLELLERAPLPARRPLENLADLEAQLASVRTGADLLLSLAAERGLAEVRRYMGFVQDNAAVEVERALARLTPGRHAFSDRLDDGTPICVTLDVGPSGLVIDFTGTGPEQLTGNLNAPHAVTTAAVLYFLRLLVGKPIPLNSGCLRHVRLTIPPHTLLSPGPERAVAGGNVETSQRVVDALLAATQLMAASQGSMNNVSFGDGSYGYYETIAGGAGAGPTFDGASAVHTHMTNTRITDAEVLERRFPVRVLEHAVRRGSGGGGQHRGGDGVRRTFEFLQPTQVSVLSQRRMTAPFGLGGGSAGATGQNLLNDRELPGAVTFEAHPGDRLTVLTPGGGGFGRASS